MRRTDLQKWEGRTRKKWEGLTRKMRRAGLEKWEGLTRKKGRSDSKHGRSESKQRRSDSKQIGLNRKRKVLLTTHSHHSQFCMIPIYPLFNIPKQFELVEFFVIL